MIISVKVSYTKEDVKSCIGTFINFRIKFMNVPIFMNLPLNSFFLRVAIIKLRNLVVMRFNNRDINFNLQPA